MLPLKCSRLRLLTILSCVAALLRRSMSTSTQELGAEDAFHAQKCVLQTQHAGFTGTGYCDFSNGNGEYLEWEVDVPSAEEYVLALRYASVTSRPLQLHVNGDQKATFSIPATSAWTNWQEEHVYVDLAAGKHVLRLVADQQSGPNVDRLKVIPSSIFSSSTSSSSGTGTYAKTQILASGGSFPAGSVFTSPNGIYVFKMDAATGNILLLEGDKVIWRTNINGGASTFLQPDGNLVVRGPQPGFDILWVSTTHYYDNSIFVIDDGGQAGVMRNGKYVWMVGIPRGSYTGPSSPDIQFPVRGMFYYPWYPETWSVNDQLARFIPEIGLYNSGDESVAINHVDALAYAHTDLAIASWWGPDSNKDRARIQLLMDETIEQGLDMKWTVYHEDEFNLDVSVDQLKQELNYLKHWFAWHPAWAHKDGKPVIFVYNEGTGNDPNSNPCEVADRWTAASNGEWYVVLKVFYQYYNCPNQPDSWHQYGPADATVETATTYAVSPGFWRADLPVRLPRVSESQWITNVQNMVASGKDWQLVTTFNEAGEGTLVEACPEWASQSGYGYYLDALHNYH